MAREHRQNAIQCLSKTCCAVIFQNLSMIILIHLYAKICAKITQNHVSASHLICICLDFYLNKKIEIEEPLSRQ